ncbi:MAG: tetratricopeptide repeat protein [Planctomycetota bacterium]
MATATFLAFLPALSNGFLRWDDQATLIENIRYRGLGSANLKWMFTTFHYGHYQPLAWLSYAIDYKVWGLDPFGFHLTNLLLHATSAGLLFVLALRLLATTTDALKGDRLEHLSYGAACCALLWGVHPLRVEAVVWATERREVLAGVFFLLTVLAYVAAARAANARTRRWWLAGSTGFYGLSLLAKGIAMTAPAVLFVLDLYPLGRLKVPPGAQRRKAAKRIVLEKIPFLALAVPTACLAAVGQLHVGALESIKTLWVLDRLALVAWGVLFYLRKTIMPLGLVPMYEIPVSFSPWDMKYVLSGALALGITVLLAAWRRRLSGVLAAWLAYLILLSPVSGIVQNGRQAAADRFTYLASMPLALLMGWTITRCAVPADAVRRVRKILPWVAAAGISTLGFLTWRQAGVWKDNVSLWTHALRHDSRCSTAHLNLGYAQAKSGDMAEAMSHFEAAIVIRPDYAEAHDNLGNAYLSMGDADRAIAEHKEAIRINPRYARAHNNLGNAWVHKGEIGQAIWAYRQAIEIDPEYANAYTNLGGAYLRKGDMENALTVLLKAVRLAPDDPQAHLQLALAFSARGQRALARTHLERAGELGLRLDPALADTLREK